MNFGGHRNDDSFKPLLFRRWGSNLDSHRKLVFSYQGMDNLLIPFKGSGKTPFSLSLIFHKPLSQFATVVCSRITVPMGSRNATPYQPIVVFHDNIRALTLKRGVCFLCNRRPNSGRHQFLRAVLHIRRLGHRKLYKQRLQFFHPLSSDNSAADNRTAPAPAVQRK